MKLVRFGPSGKEKPGVLLDQSGKGGNPNMILDVSSMAFDIHDYDEHFFTHWGLDRIRALLNEKNPSQIPLSKVRLGPPIARPANIICLGANYPDHAAEIGMKRGGDPLYFSKSVSAINGPYDPIRIPVGDAQVDAEVELGVVIGDILSNATPEEATAAVAGYLIVNDVTDRHRQSMDSQWFAAKSCDTFCPIGPWLVTPDEIEDPYQLTMTSRIDGKIIQNASTSGMLLRIPEIIAMISACMTLRAGDIIATGTPAGVGITHSPPRTLRVGDTLELTNERLRTQRAQIITA